MKNLLISIAIAAALSIVAKSYSQTFYGIDDKREKEASRNLKLALEKSVESMLAGGLAVSDHNIFISYQKQYIVVSFRFKEKNVKGGGAHVVYDPKLEKVIYTVGED
jgi:hypothetical protein